MRTPSLRLVVLAGLAVAALAGAAMAQTPVADKPAEKPAVKPVRSIPYVSILGDDGRQRHYETNAIPLLFNRACFGWRMHLGGPNRTVTLTEVLTTSQPAEQVIAGPETEVSADRTKATTCLQLYPTGQLHSPVENRAGRPAGNEKYAATS